MMDTLLLAVNADEVQALYGQFLSLKAHEGGDAVLSLTYVYE